MRTLTITRGKTFVGCLGKLKLYIEDYNAPEITILDTPCRKLGTLKNGETKNFEIPEEGVKVFAIFDKVSKGYCNEYYPIPAGNEPVVLTGKCKYNPANGNAFRFDGVTDEAVLENRRKGSNKGLIVLVVALVLGVMIGFGVSFIRTLDSMIESPETFEGDGYSITLTDSFDRIKTQDFNAVYESRDAVVMLYEETFADYPVLKTTTAREYADVMRTGVEYSTTGIVTTEDGLLYFDYFAEIDGDAFTYRVFVIKGDAAFWTLQVAVFTDDMADKEAEILEWAKSFSIK